ncbi:MAG: tetratricopeptide repeat protein [Bacteroidales bacterium]|nr:tetratricopeptide repeat protein [Bacteroidales bacterium]
MKKLPLILIIFASLHFSNASAQTSPDYSKIDMMLGRGEYNRVIDTCKLILSADSLNDVIYYKMGLAYQNFLPDDKSFDCYLKASEIAPENKIYRFMVAKGYNNKGKNKMAAPLLESLYEADTMNWTYAYYLTSIYMLDKKYDESLKIYKRFYEKDSTDYVVLDKIGFALLRKGFYPTAIEYYNKSLAINPKNIGSIKNLSFLYASTLMADTALKLLTMGIKIDSSDLDLYIRRAALNFSYNYTKRALDDYLRIMATGDSTLLFIKRAGIGYHYNLQNEKAVEYLKIAFKKDSTDIEVSTFLARSYERMKDYKTSAWYYRSIIRNLNPYLMQLSYAYISLAQTLNTDGLHKEAIDNYLAGQKFGPNRNTDMIIANIYDEKLNDIPNALRYYQRVLNNYKNDKMPPSSKYYESVQKRVDYLKEKQATAAKK